MGIFMKTLGQRIKEERKKRGWSQTFLAERVGVTQAAISEIERDVPKSSGLVVPIAKAFKVDTYYLTDGKEYITRNTPQPEEVYILGGERHGQLAEPSEYIMIPRYDVRGSCGDGIDVSDVNIVDAMPFPSSLAKMLALPSPEMLAVVQASGDSMSPTINDSQVLIVNTADVEPRSTKIYLVCLNGRLFIKRLIYTPDGWVMRSDNPNKDNYPDFKIEPSKVDHIDIQGRVVWQSGAL